MPRIARIVVPGQAHHVTQRGNRRMETFFCDEDYQEYLSLLGHWCGEFDVRIWSYCLMPNHVHLILVPQTVDGLWRAVSETHRRYTRRINFRERWRGHLWQGRFASFVMSENHLMGAARYVERNPVKADLVERAEDWRWSSAAAHCAACDSGGDMTEMQSEAESEAEHLGSCPQTAAECDWLIERSAGMTSTWSEHLAWVDDTEFAVLMRQRENTGRPLGDADFVKEIGRELSRDLLPKKPGPKGPKKKTKKPKTRKTG
jgi:putative transposase